MKTINRIDDIKNVTAPMLDTMLAEAAGIKACRWSSLDCETLGWTKPEVYACAVPAPESSLFGFRMALPLHNAAKTPYADSRQALLGELNVEGAEAVLFTVYDFDDSDCHSVLVYRDGLVEKL